MGIIDDYYGGYESLAMFMDEDGVIDYEAAYDAQLPDDDGYFDPDMDPWERAFDYQFNRVLRANALPGWSDTGRKNRWGKALWEGSCSSCGKHTTVPFVPLLDGNPPQCKQCHQQSKGSRLDQQGGSRGRGSGRGRNRDRKQGRGGASSSNAGGGNNGGGCSSRADGTGNSSRADGAGGSSSRAEEEVSGAGVSADDVQQLPDAIQELEAAIKRNTIRRD